MQLRQPWIILDNCSDSFFWSRNFVCFGILLKKNLVGFPFEISFSFSGFDCCCCCSWNSSNFSAILSACIHISSWSIFLICSANSGLFFLDLIFNSKYNHLFLEHELGKTFFPEIAERVNGDQNKNQKSGKRHRVEQWGENHR